VASDISTLSLHDALPIWFAHDRKFGNPYGHSALRQVYKHWYIKDKLYRFANIAYERYGTPLLVGHVQDAKDVNKMRRLLERINRSEEHTSELQSRENLVC